EAIDMTIDPGLSPGVHVVQVLNPNGWASNEMPICVTNVELGRPLPAPEGEACKPNDRVTTHMNSPPCPTAQLVQASACDPGVEGAVRACGTNPAGTRCEMTLYCFGPGACEDAAATAVCALP